MHAHSLQARQPACAVPACFCNLQDAAANANPGHVAAVEADGNTVADEAPGVSSSGEALGASLA